MSGSATSTPAPGLLTVKEEDEEEEQFLNIMERDKLESVDGGMNKMLESFSSLSVSPQR